MFTVSYKLNGKVYKTLCLCVASLLDTVCSIMYDYYENDDMTIDVHNKDDELIWSI